MHLHMSDLQEVYDLSLQLFSQQCCPGNLVLHVSVQELRESCEQESCDDEAVVVVL